MGLLWLAVWLLSGCREPEHTIRRTLRAGDQWQYTLTLQGALREQTDTLELRYTDRVLSIEADGSAIAERTLQMPPDALQRLQASAAPFGALKPKTRWKLFPDGRETPLDEGVFVIGAFAYAYPDRPVRIGAQWGRMARVGSLEVKYLCQLEAIETLAGVSCYRIRVQVEPMPDSLPQMQGEMTVHVDAHSGWTRQIRGTLNMRAGGVEGNFALTLRGKPVGEQP
jgi:YD repeat-containing protein